MVAMERQHFTILLDGDYNLSLLPLENNCPSYLSSTATGNSMLFILSTDPQFFINTHPVLILLISYSTSSY